jgi:hypothetical protein
MRATIQWCRATPRRLWWSVALVFCVLGGCWSVATPLFASPDEPAHVVRAASVVRGEILGSDPPKHSRALRGSLLVDLPAIYASGSKVACYAFQPNTPANCASFTGSTTKDEEIPTSAGRHPPWFYAIIGLPSLVFVSGTGVRLMRLLNVALTAALLASAVITLLRFPRFRLVALGFAAAITPMVLFLAGVVNPSAIEIAAAVLLWIAGYTLVSEIDDGVDLRVVVRMTVAGSVLTLTRQLGPFWLGVIALTLLAIAGWRVAKRLWGTRPVRIGIVVVLACTLVQLVWLAAAGTLDAANSNVPGIPGTTTQLASGSLGRGLLYYHELIGVFGWRDTAPPTAVWLFWTAVLAGLVAFAVLVASRRLALAVLTTAVLTWGIPIALEARSANSAGYFWQGRYTLPLAVGVPILAAFAFGARRWSHTVVTRVAWIVGVALGLSQVLAFIQAIHRYAVGTRHKFDFFTSTPWEPPLPALFLTVVFVIGVIAWYLLLLGRAATGDDQAEILASDGTDDDVLVPSRATATG